MQWNYVHHKYASNFAKFDDNVIEQLQEKFDP